MITDNDKNEYLDIPDKLPVYNVKTNGNNENNPIPNIFLFISQIDDNTPANRATRQYIV